MVTGGNATVFISNMDAAIGFYTTTLGMTLKEHYGDHWATVESGGFTVGLHPRDGQSPLPGTAGSITVGLVVADIAACGEALRGGGAKEIGDVVAGDGGSFLNFQDPDGNRLYLWQMPKWG
jgi:predicted enzyme related to lactoylglutathione lyase